jgi:acetyl esterase/lipase
LKVTTIIGFGLLWMAASVPVLAAQRAKPSAVHKAMPPPVPDSQRVTLQLQHVPVSMAMRLLFASVRAKGVIDPSVTGSVSVDITGAAFSDAMRALMDGADQPLRCSFRNGAYHVTVPRQPEAEAKERVVGLPRVMTVADAPGAVPPRPEPMPFVWTAPDGSFREEASRAVSQVTGESLKLGSPMQGHLLMDGAVVIRPLVPYKTLSVSNGPEWTLPGGVRNGTLNLSPVRPMLFDTASETVEVKKGVVVLRDKTGRSVTIYPYFPETVPPLTFALYPNRTLTAADTAGEKSVLQGEPGHQIIWVTGVRWPTLTAYLPPKETATGAAVVICPGGGYGGEAMDLEGYDVARRFVGYGVAGIVLKYRLPTADMSRSETPWPIQDGQQAIRLVRDHAREWNIDPHRVGIMGFSAGGHLASSVATHLQIGDPKALDRGARLSSRPDFLVLGYPVITMRPPVVNEGSRNNLLGVPADPRLVTLYSNDEQVTAQTPPTFLVQAEDDPVSVQNSVLFSEALKGAGVPYEFLRLKTGGHGFGLGVHGGEPADWPDRCAAWLRANHFLGDLR